MAKRYATRRVQHLQNCVGRIDVRRDPDGQLYLSCVPKSKTRRLLSYTAEWFDNIDWWENALHLFDMISMFMVMFSLMCLIIMIYQR